MNSSENMPRAVVVIPTYNEALNIQILIPLLCTQVFPKIPSWDLSMVVVDGSSKDGTGEIVSSFTKKYPNVHLIAEENKSGIGSAYMKGFRYAIDRLSADVVIEFDADFQHPPADIESLLNKIDQGFDLVIGSRFIEGGSKSTGGKIWRTALTKMGGFISRMILFFPSSYFYAVTDPTSGLRATRVKECLTNMKLDISHLHSQKFGYKLQLLYEIISKNIRYAEIPLLFGTRNYNKSKIEITTPFEILISCFMTRIGMTKKCKLHDHKEDRQLKCNQ